MSVVHDTGKRWNHQEFLSAMFHELRTPLNAILGYAGTLLMRHPGPLTIEQEKELHVIQSSARYLASLLNNFSELETIEAGNMRIQLEPVECQKLLDDLATSLRSTAETKKLTLERPVPCGDIIVYADRHALQRILSNLVENAIKFTERGFIRLEAEQKTINSEITTEITVSDTGPGIRPEDRDKLFHAFSRVGSTRGLEGAGIGLYLSQLLARLMGGQISVAGEYGKGSRFSLTLVTRSLATESTHNRGAVGC